MDFALSDDQKAIRETAESYLAEAAGLDRLRAVIGGPAGFDDELWAGLAGDMGFAGLMVPEIFGGAGLGAVEMALVLEQIGARLAVIPFFETAVLAVQTILTAGTESQKAALLPELAAGRLKAAFAFAPASGWAGPQAIGPNLTRTDGGRVLRGAAGFVSFAHVADLLMIAAAGSEGLSLIALPATAPGIVIERLPPLDLTRPYALVKFADVAVPNDAILGAPGSASAAFAKILAVGSGMLAAEQTGGAAFCLASTVEYSKQRVQFGRLIGSFQAMKHEMANMMLRVEAARSAAYYAAAAIDEGGAELAEAAAVARAWCSDTYQFCAGEAIQLHGGIGFTSEHHAHLYFKRARSSSSWFGNADEQRAAIARLILPEVS